MNQDLWTGVDSYFGQKLSLTDEALEAVLLFNESEGLPAIDVSPSQGKLLYLLAKLQGARRILEVGTLGGYSTIWLARALPKEGKIVTLEIDPKHAQVAKENLQRAGFSSRVDIMIGKALDSLTSLRSNAIEAFDMVFIDADKISTCDYFQRALQLSRPGTLIIVDNVVRKGELVNDQSTDASVLGMRRFMDYLSTERRVEATGLQTVGKKGYDGLVLARVVE